MKVIDPHIHLFALTQGNYHWLKPENQPFWSDKEKINKPFTEEDFQQFLPFSSAGFVHIEAGFDNDAPHREIDWLEKHCSLPFKSIAFADINCSNFAKRLNVLNQYSSFVGIRHILDDDAVKILQHPNTISNLALLSENDLIFELQLSCENSDAIALFIEIKSVLPTLKVTLNHAGFFNTQNEILWLENIRKLASLQNVATKFSGFEMVNRKLDYTALNACLMHLVSEFGEHRVMFASNYPVCLLTHNAESVWQTYIQSLNLTPSQITKFCHDNAQHWYHFD